MRILSSRVVCLARVLMTASLLIAGGSPILAGDAGTLPVHMAQQTEPVTLYAYNHYPLVSLDPQFAADSPSIGAIENLFLGLTDFHPVTNNAVPELASSWTVSEDGTLWTFTLRGDVPWVRWDPATQQADILRMVTADDVAYGIQRLCDPRLEAFYAGTASRLISGCGALANMAKDVVTDADYDRVRVRALDDTTLEIKLNFAAGYFLSMSTMWIYRPVPREIIEEYGEDWTEVGTIVTNGPFVLDERVDGARRVFLRNPYLPDDLRGPGNVERVVVAEIGDHFQALALYKDNQLDSTGVPTAELAALQADPAYADQLVPYYDLLVEYFGFTHDKPPFDNVHARRAFAAIVDRQRFIDEEVFLPYVAPMIHFTPPGVFGAPPIDEVGVGFDPDYALEQLALVGYPGCEGFPELRVLVWEKAGVWGEFLVDRMEEVLGCDPDRLRVEAVQDELYFSIIDPVLPPEGRPDMWTLVWCPDYPDANNYVGDVLGCGSGQPFNRPCTAIDDLIDQAAAASDVLTRTDLYRDIEDRFFGPDGEHPMIPMFMSGTLSLHKPWYNGPFGTDGVFGVPHFDWYTIDQAAQLAARGG